MIRLLAPYALGWLSPVSVAFRAIGGDMAPLKLTTMKKNWPGSKRGECWRLTAAVSPGNETSWPINWRIKHMRSLLLSSIVLALAGCGGSTPYVDGADPCAKPVQIPAGWLSDQQIEVLWGQDRLELMKCGDKVETLSGRAVE